MKKGATAAARRYNVSRATIYRWLKRYNGTLDSLKDRSHRPHSHPNQHTEEEIKLISPVLSAVFIIGGALSIALFADYAINSSSIEWDKRPLITAGDNQLSTQGYLDSDKVERFKYYKIGIKLQYNIFW